MRKLNTLQNAGHRRLPNAAERREFENVLQKRKIDRIFEKAKGVGVFIPEGLLEKIPDFTETFKLCAPVLEDKQIVPKSNAPVFDKHTIKFDKAGVYTVTVTPDGVTCEPVQKPKPEYQDIFDGTSRLGDIVNCEGVLLRREKGTCSDCHLMTFDYTDCYNTTNCESDCFKPYVPEIE